MRKIIGFFKQRWLISLLGVFALAILIWFAGPYLEFADYRFLEGEVNRLVLILVLVLLWGLNNLRRQIKAKGASSRIMDDLMTSAPASPVRDQSAEEVTLLRKRFEEAMEMLTKSRRAKGAANLYELPWYLIIGPPGSGKTTALQNSNLNFPLAERFGMDELKGVGGTRNCNWWFTDEAILLDTAGRWVTQDSHAQVDSAAWIGFLDLLKKYRKRRPINGVIVAISAADLLMHHEQERSSDIVAIRQRINELHQHFGIRFPIYVLVTKCDLISGFTEFFDDLGHETRFQVWGFTFTLNEKVKRDNGIHSFADEYDALIRRLDERLLWRLNQERDVGRRALIFSFPQQMNALKEVLDQFLTEIFRPTRYAESPLLRGVYFTSGTQEGTPIDRIMGKLVRGFGLSQQALPAYHGPGRSYFITRVLRDVMFPEAELAGSNRRLESRRAWVQRSAYVTVILITAAALGAWSASYMTNKHYVDEIGEKVSRYLESSAQPRLNDPGYLETVQRLDALRATTQLSREHAEGIPYYMRLGLYQGGTLGNAANDAYAREMNVLLVPLIDQGIENQLRNRDADPELQYEILKTYLMLGDPDRLNPDQLTILMSLDWNKRFETDPELQHRLRDHLDDLLISGIKPIQLDQELVRLMRAKLRRLSLAKFVYERFKRESKSSSELPFRLSETLGPEGEQVFVRAGGGTLNQEIPSIFTYRGFHNIYLKKNRSLVDEIREERWVLDIDNDQIGSEALNKLDAELAEMYYGEYIKAWEGLLEEIEIVRFRTFSQATKVLDILSSPASPMLSLLRAVDYNTSLTRLPGGTKQVQDKLDGKVGQVRDRLAQLWGEQEPSPPVPKLELPGNRVEERFEKLNGLVQAQDGSSPPVDRVIELVSELYNAFDAMRGGPGAGNALQKLSSGADITRRLRREAAQQPQPVQRWMNQLASYNRALTAGGVRAELDELLDSEIVYQCKTMLGGRYPLVKNSSLEVTLQDFARFFGPGGTMDAFFKKHLEPFVDKSRRPWRWRTNQEVPLGLSNTVLLQFQRARMLRDTFFQQGDKKISVRFSLKPKSLDNVTSRFTLELGMQRFEYRHGPQRVKNALWPDPNGVDGVKIEFEDRNGIRHSDYAEGPWAWFRILDRAVLERVSPDRLRVTFEVERRRVKYELRASSVVNPFLMTEMQQFRCPENM